MNLTLIHQLKTRISENHSKIRVMELHLDGHRGDHLLVYAKTPTQNAVYLIDIGTHSDLFI